jgi:Tfp pilus assembly protein PilX
MGSPSVVRHLTNQRGVALPMALLSLVLLTTLMLAFAVLSQTEPVIAANQLRVSQARALAESGFEYAVWALTNSTDPKGLGSPLASSPAPTPFDGNTFVLLGGTGGFLVKVINDPAGDANVRQITSVGWTPTNSSTDTHTKAHRQIQASVVVVPNLALQAPCALCVKGELSVGGNSTIVGTNTDSKCGGNNKAGTYTLGATTTGGSASVTGGPTASYPGCPAPCGVAQNQPASTFDGFTYTNADLNALKALAMKNGTYFGPGFSGSTDANGKAVTGTYTGSVSFNSSNKVANGVVFIDTTNGVNLTTSGSDTSTLAYLDIHGNPFADPSGNFTGVLVINGSLNISGNMQINGIVYAVNDLTYNGTGTGAIYGLAVSQNIRDTSATSIDSNTNGNSLINFDCSKASAALFIPPGFALVPGSYREISD